MEELKNVKELKLITNLCWTIHDPELDIVLPPHNVKCKMLSSALFAGKSNLPRGSPRRVFVQDLAASLNRKRILLSENYEDFLRLAYKYMEM